MLNADEIERVAQRRAGAKLRWYLHALVYVCFNLFIFAMSQRGLGHRPWSALPSIGWGLGLALHGFSVFVLGGNLRDRLVERERLRRRAMDPEIE